ncbi:MAG: RNA polymerase sigma factor [Planctomycetota bacterium]|jgi:RNA polymerase sigma-70 factor (ECF subfamily)
MDDEMTRLQDLYQLHGPVLARYLRRITGQTELTEDLVQETFLQALRRIDGLAEVVSPKAWLFTIARNLSMTAYRKQRSISGLSKEITESDECREDPRLYQMRQAIDSLSDKHREVLGLRLHDELSYEEISHVLGIPVGTVRSRLHHAVRQLREKIKGKVSYER